MIISSIASMDIYATLIRRFTDKATITWGPLYTTSNTSGISYTDNDSSRSVCYIGPADSRVLTREQADPAIPAEGITFLRDNFFYIFIHYTDFVFIKFKISCFNLMTIISSKEE